MNFTPEEIALMFQLVKEGLAESDIVSSDDMGTECLFCDGVYVGLSERDGIKHKDDCLILKARKLVSDHEDVKR